ncbi:MAG TPA: amylo-alpha-1,6-glucosidase [Puia sp.]|nr:amylo-alpha-1,6-glucosidase [Puia sp.]
MLIKGQSELNHFDSAIQYEWLETNGLGGWSGSSVLNCNTRRYHGLLVAATNPPAERMNLLSKLDEAIVTQDGRFELATNQYADHVIHPAGYQYLQQFFRDLFPEWIYELNGIRIGKTIAMPHGENTTLIIYDVLNAETTFSLELLPLISAKGYHSLRHASDNIWWDVSFENGIFRNRPFEGAPEIFISVPGSSYRHEPKWFYRFNYAVEIYRGQDFEEDLFNHGVFSVSLKQGDSLGIIVSTDNPKGRDTHQLLKKETARRLSLLKDFPSDETFRQLVLAADQFIVKRTIPGLSNSESREGATVIAGYHWFTDWGRDTMISLPGLCISTGRFEDAKKILSAFARSVSQGMLPNRFQDNQEPPEYNNVDGTLWYFIAVYKYLQATNDVKFILGEILPVLKNIIDWHYKGTRYHIHVDDDGLLFAGEEGQQLTWMDARIGHWVVTPRMGKPVEIQALWFNVLKIFSKLLLLNNQMEDALAINQNAEIARGSFTKKFWFAKGGYLYDVIDENGMTDPSLRPNQLFAISLPFPLLRGERAASVLKVVGEKLYTPIGLRSLNTDDIHYTGIYGGDAYKRDSSYHEGTVWTWLLGPYVDAIMKTEKSKYKAERVIQKFSYHLSEGCIGTVSEIADGDGAHHPRGCVAQAWGVAEILRVIKDYDLKADKTVQMLVMQ